VPHRCCRRCECSRTTYCPQTSGPITSGEKYRFREPSLGTNAAIPLSLSFALELTSSSAPSAYRTAVGESIILLLDKVGPAEIEFTPARQCRGRTAPSPGPPSHS